MIATVNLWRLGQLGTLGSVVSLLAATIYQGNYDRNNDVLYPGFISTNIEGLQW